MDVALTLHAPGDLLRAVATQAKRRRLGLDLTQKALAERSGIPLGSIRHFERTGRISLQSLVNLAIALGAETGFLALFPSDPPRSIPTKPPRQRARRQ